MTVWIWTCAECGEEFGAETLLDATILKESHAAMSHANGNQA